MAARDIEFDGGEFLMGTAPGAARFVFDNEKWAHPVRVAPFAIANRCVSNAEFARFVDAGGYDRREWWTEGGWAWRAGANAAHPVYWRRDGAQWRVRRNDRWTPLDDAQSVMHVNLHEAEAWCAWAQRRLPSEAEWEFAARAGGGPATYPWGDDAALLDGCTLGYRTDGPAAAGIAAPELGPLAHLIGNVWEWTVTRFEPYPGFSPDPYADYSAPWFGNHTVLRGGSFATAPWLVHNRFRNFYMPHRCDVFAGFRTCAIG
jgi:iron(II)-dependent oxidoreductase